MKATSTDAKVLLALQRALPGFTAVRTTNTSVGGGEFHSVDVPRERLPLPAIPRLVLTLLGCQSYGPGEKMAWEIAFYVDGIACILTLEKFGLRLYVRGIDEREAVTLARRIIGRLDRAQRVVERDVLRPMAEEQADLGNVTLVNQHLHLRGAYTYFRDGARDAYAGAGRIPKRTPEGSLRFMVEEEEGFYNTVAMIASYFSLLEHILTLALPFTRPPAEPLNVREFLGMRWSAKYQYSFELHRDREVKRHYDRLSQVAEEYRNTYAHGGFDKAGATLAFHIPGIGAVPAVLSDIRNRPQFTFVPVSVKDFAHAAAVLDDFDVWLSTHGLADAMPWITSPLDVRYDDAFRREFARAKATAGGAEAMLRRELELWERAANMDY